MEQYNESNMKKNSLFCLVFYILIFTYSCTPKSSVVDNNTLVINLSKEPISKKSPNAYTCSQFYNHIEGFQIDFKGGLLGEIYKVLSTKNLYLFVDKKHSNSIQVYDKTGSFNYVIKRIGKGPGEYLKIQDCCIENEILFVYDFVQKKIISYDVNTGSFLNEKKTDLFFANFEKCSGFTYYYNFYSKDMNYWLIIEDNNTNKRTGYFPYSLYKYKNLPQSGKPFFKSNGNVIFYLGHMYTFYKIKGDKVESYIEILPKPNGKLASMLLETENNKISMMELMKNGIILFCNFYEDTNLLYFNFVNCGKGYSLILNKQKKLYEIQRVLYDDITNTHGTFFYDQTENKLIKVIDPGNCYWLKNKGVDTTKATIESLDLFNNFDINGNPIITISSFK